MSVVGQIYIIRNGEPVLLRGVVLYKADFDEIATVVLLSKTKDGYFSLLGIDDGEDIEYCLFDSDRGNRQTIFRFSDCNVVDRFMPTKTIVTDNEYAPLLITLKCNIELAEMEP